MGEEEEEEEGCLESPLLGQDAVFHTGPESPGCQRFTLEKT